MDPKKLDIEINHLRQAIADVAGIVVPGMQP
jgi:hypothetical protein